MSFNVARVAASPLGAPTLNAVASQAQANMPIGVAIKDVDKLTNHTVADPISDRTKWGPFFSSIGYELMANITFFFMLGLVTGFFPQSSLFSGLYVGAVLFGVVSILHYLTSPALMLSMNPVTSLIMTIVHWCLVDADYWRKKNYWLNDLLKLAFFWLVQIFGSLFGFMAASINFLDGETSYAEFITVPRPGIASWVSVTNATAIYVNSSVAVTSNAMITDYQIVIAETVGTMFIVMAALIVYSAKNLHERHEIGAVLRGTVLLFVTALYYQATGASFNPFRFIWPLALRGANYGSTGLQVAYIAGPFFGGFLAGAAYLAWILIGGKLPRSSSDASSSSSSSSTSSSTSPLLPREPQERTAAPFANIINFSAFGRS
jgi:glycerol uptake facilitator-like aquaporin